MAPYLNFFLSGIKDWELLFPARAAVILAQLRDCSNKWEMDLYTFLKHTPKSQARMCLQDLPSTRGKLKLLSA